MKTWIILGIGLFSQMMFADSLPVFTSQPISQTVVPHYNVLMAASASGATAYQWRHNGTNIPWGIDSTLQLTNAQLSDTGYYLVLAQNDVGWSPSQMAYLAVVDIPAMVPLSNLANSNSYHNGEVYTPFSDNEVPLPNGSAQVMAGPELDQMHFVKGFSYQASVSNGFFNLTQPSAPPPAGFPPPNANPRYVPVLNAESGQPLYYSVYVAFTNGGNVATQQSTVIQIAGSPTASTFDLKFPVWLEWPDSSPAISATPAQYVAVPGETITFTNVDYAYLDLAYPTAHWRKDGGSTDTRTGSTGVYTFGMFVTTLTITNIQPDDAGVYDAEIFWNNCFDSPKIQLSVQTANGHGVFQMPNLTGTNFTFSFAGAASRNYQIQWSTNLVNWNNLTIITNTTGNVAFTNSAQLGNAVFYRSQLLP